PPGNPGRARLEELFSAARLGILEVLQLGLGLLLVLHRERRGRVRKIRGHDLLSRRPGRLRQSIHRFRVKLAGERIPASPGNEFSGAGGYKPHRPRRAASATGAASPRALVGESSRNGESEWRGAAGLFQPLELPGAGPKLERGRSRGDQPADEPAR